MDHLHERRASCHLESARFSRQIPLPHRSLRLSHQSVLSSLSLSLYPSIVLTDVTRTDGALILTAVMSDFANKSTCNQLSRAVVSMAAVGTLSSEAILCFRTSALWSNNRTIVALCITMIVVEAALMIFSLTTWQGNDLPPGITGCFPGPDPTRKV